jgi:hypothetical protein
MNQEIDRLEGWVFPAGWVLPDCPGKTSLTGFPNRSNRFSPVGCHEEFLAGKSLSCYGFLVQRMRGSWGVLGQFWSRRCFGDFLDKTGLTGLPNRPDQFSPVGCREEFLSRKVSVVLWLFLFKWGEVLEVFWGSFSLEGVSGISWTKPAWPICQTRLTSFPCLLRV